MIPQHHSQPCMQQGHCRTVHCLESAHLFSKCQTEKETKRKEDTQESRESQSSSGASTTSTSLLSNVSCLLSDEAGQSQPQNSSHIRQKKIFCWIPSVIADLLKHESKKTTLSSRRRQPPNCFFQSFLLLWQLLQTECRRTSSNHEANPREGGMSFRWRNLRDGWLCSCNAPYESIMQS